MLPFSFLFLPENDTVYSCEWASVGDRTTMQPHELRTYRIVADHKDTFTYLDIDMDRTYALNSGKYGKAYTNAAVAYDLNGNKIGQGVSRKLSLNPNQNPPLLFSKGGFFMEKPPQPTAHPTLPTEEGGAAHVAVTVQPHWIRRSDNKNGLRRMLFCEARFRSYFGIQTVCGPDKSADKRREVVIFTAVGLLIGKHIHQLAV